MRMPCRSAKESQRSCSSCTKLAPRRRTRRERTHKVVAEVRPRVPESPHRGADEDAAPGEDGGGDELELGVVQEGEGRLRGEGGLVAAGRTDRVRQIGDLWR